MAWVLDPSPPFEKRSPILLVASKTVKSTCSVGILSNIGMEHLFMSIIRHIHVVAITLMSMPPKLGFLIFVESYSLLIHPSSINALLLLLLILP